MNNNVRILVICLLSAGLLACKSTEDKIGVDAAAQQSTNLKPSYLRKAQGQTVSNNVDNASGEQQRKQEFSRLEPLGSSTDASVTRISSSQSFDVSRLVTIAADNIPLPELIHKAFGEVLKVNYVLAQDVKNDQTRVSLNITQPVSALELYRMLSNLLVRYQINIDFDSDTFFLQKAQLSKAKAVIGIGRDIASVPNTSGNILQVIPIKYGIKLSMERIVRDLIDGNISVDIGQSAIFVNSNRSNVLRAIELVQLLDVPSNRGKNIALLSLTYISVTEFLKETRLLLNTEGIAAGVGEEPNKNVLMVPLNHIGAIAVFASDEELLERVKYWATIMDVPTQGENQQYFIYTPKYARAADIGESVGQLLTIGRPAPRSNKNTTGSNGQELAASSPSQDNIVNAADVSFVVDERSNTLIFNTTGSQYQILLPLLDRLDILPKQVLLEVMIAEVTLNDDFRFGVEFALRNSQEFSATTLGGLGASEISGLNFGFISDGIAGGTQATAAFFRENQYVNVISNPTLLVRDGVSASINVGSSIPVQGGTVVDQGVQTTSIDYRKTGVDLTVTPTVNAQGVVIMTISQNISNTIDATASSTTPSIFERSIDTEAVVNSGQTVILGGLISEDTTYGDTKVPVLGDIPLLGNLFRSKNDKSSKTELVMLVTPRVIESNDEWEKLIDDFQSGLKNMNFEK